MAPYFIFIINLLACAHGRAMLRLSNNSSRTLQNSSADTNTELIDAHNPVENTVNDTSDLVIVQLKKRYVPVKHNGVVVMHKTAHFGQVMVGLPNPQQFTVVFDTGSGYFFVPSSTCPSAACKNAGRSVYNKSLSQSIHSHQQHRSLTVEYGTGTMTGEIANEVVCLKDHTGDASKNHNDCAELRVLLATELSDEPFNSFEFDGVIGLGLLGLVDHPEYSFFDQMSKMFPGNLKSLFGVFISRSDNIPSEISFGGHDERRVASNLKWANVISPELGYWQVKIEHVIIGDTPYEPCEDGQCYAIVDSGTSLIGVPKALTRELHYKMARNVDDYQEGLDCRDHPGPEMIFDLGDDVLITLGQDDYSRPAPLKVITTNKNTTNATVGVVPNTHTNTTANETVQFLCRASLLPVSEGGDLAPKTWILGEPMFRKYYTTFDWKQKRIGFSPSVQPISEGAVAETAPILTPSVHYV